MTSSFLERVCAQALERVAADRAEQSDGEVISLAQQLPDPPGFADALGQPALAVITEVKRASPSRGRMADIPDPTGLARAYVAGGASAISVLTEPDHFDGSLHDLQVVSAAVEIPVLRKDFVVDAYQVWQARAAGAAATLLIVAALDDGRLTELIVTAGLAGIDCLVETHSAAEIGRAVQATVRAGTGRRLVLGVNARDLVTLEVDRSHIARVRQDAELPDDALLVAESGIRGPADVAEYAAMGADAVLVGEHVATAADPQEAVAALVAAGHQT